MVAGRTAADLDEADALVADIEADGRGLPVLLRQYLKLNARILGWNVDRRFGRALDGLMLVDLVDVPRPLLGRYLGKDGAAGFLAAQEIGEPETRVSHGIHVDPFLDGRRASAGWRLLGMGDGCLRLPPAVLPSRLRVP